MSKKGTMSPQEQAEYAYAYDSPWGLSPEAKVIYARMVAEGNVARRSADAPDTPADPLAGIMQRECPRAESPAGREGAHGRRSHERDQRSARA